MECVDNNRTQQQRKRKFKLVKAVDEELLLLRK